MSYINIKQIVVSFILCGAIALTNNADNVKQVNANKASGLKECQNEQDKIQGCVEKDMQKGILNMKPHLKMAK